MGVMVLKKGELPQERMNEAKKAHLASQAGTWSSRSASSCQLWSFYPCLKVAGTINNQSWLLCLWSKWPGEHFWRSTMRLSNVNHHQDDDPIDIDYYGDAMVCFWCFCWLQCWRGTVWLMIVASKQATKSKQAVPPLPSIPVTDQHYMQKYGITVLNAMQYAQLGKHCTAYSPL